MWLIWTHKSRKPVFYYSISNWVLHIIPHNYPPTQFNLLYPNRAIRCLPFMKKPVSIPPYTAIMQISTKNSRHDVRYRNIKLFSVIIETRDKFLHICGYTLEWFNWQISTRNCIALRIQRAITLCLNYNFTWLLWSKGK